MKIPIQLVLSELVYFDEIHKALVSTTLLFLIDCSNTYSKSLS